jgi:hypothetical protein
MGFNPSCCRGRSVVQPDETSPESPTTGVVGAWDFIGEDPDNAGNPIGEGNIGGTQETDPPVVLLSPITRTGVDVTSKIRNIRNGSTLELSDGSNAYSFIANNATFNPDGVNASVNEMPIYWSIRGDDNGDAGTMPSFSGPVQLIVSPP